jgi:hypothetical protein
LDIGVVDSVKSPHQAIEEIVDNKLTKEIVEISNVTMGGMQGEMLVYSCSAPLPEGIQGRGLSCSPHNTPSDPYHALQINIIAYFSNGNQLWSVDSGWSESKAEQQKADFDHILQTFKIPD